MIGILAREDEIATAVRQKGRKSAAVKQMKAFDDCFHEVLNKPVQACKCAMCSGAENMQVATSGCQAKPQKTPFLYAQPHAVEIALLHQEAILKEMKKVENGREADVDLETEIGKAVKHNLEPKDRAAEWIDLENALKGPAHVARMLIKEFQDRKSKPGKLYRLNEEQLECTALFVDRLERGFQKRTDSSQPWLKPDEVLMTIITDGGGGCGKTTLAVEVILPLLEIYFGSEGVLRRAPSNKPARLIRGRTMHSGQGMTPENSMRTAALALNAQSQQKLLITHGGAGVLFIDESSQLQAELNHAAALRTTYARESKYQDINRNRYAEPDQRFGRIAFLWYSQDHLQLPPVPERSSMMASTEGTSKVFMDKARE